MFHCTQIDVKSSCKMCIVIAVLFSVLDIYVSFHFMVELNRMSRFWLASWDFVDFTTSENIEYYSQEKSVSISISLTATAYNVVSCNAFLNVLLSLFLSYCFCQHQFLLKT